MASDNARAASTPSQRQPKVLIASLFLPVALEQAVVDELTTREAHRPPVSTDGDNVVASSAFVRSPRRESLGNMLSSSSSLYAIDVYDEDEPLEPETKLRIVPSTLGNVGLQNAVNSMPRDELNCLWIGSMGPGYDDLYAQSNSAQSPPNSPSFTPSMKAEVDAELLAKHHAVNVELTDAEIHGHYHDFCKQILWPLFHSQAPDYASVSRYESTGWDMYRRVNVKFADAIAKAYQPGDTVWVNDYHLMLLPNLLRKRIPTAAVGFFLHIPFPSDEFFRCLHVRKDIVEGVLAANLIGFQPLHLSEP
ncbi:Trehalose-6-P synthase/phosphatase complex subunit [Sorochytrium milnesiophthora]